MTTSEINVDVDFGYFFFAVAIKVTDPQESEGKPVD